MSRLTDLEAEVEALRMLVGDLSDAVNTKEPKEDPADKDAKVDKPDREEVKKDQEDIGFNELLRQQEEANEVSALERFRTGPSALEDFNNETRRRRAEQEEFFNSNLLEEVLGEDPEAVKGEVQEITKDEKPKADRKPVVIDPKGSGKTQELRTNAQPGFISLKAEDSDGKYFKYEVLGVKTGSELTDPSVYNLPLAADGTRGGAQIGYPEPGTGERDYPVKLGTGADAEQMYVNVPWTDTGSYSGPFKLEKVTISGTDKVRVHAGKLYARVDTCTMSTQTILTAASTSYHASNRTDHSNGPHTDSQTLQDHTHSGGPSGGNTGGIASTPPSHHHTVPALVNSTSTSTIFKITGQAESSINTDTHAQQDFSQSTGVFYAKWEVTINSSAVVTDATLDVVRTAVGGTAPSDVPFGPLTEGSGTLTRASSSARIGTFYREIGTVTSSSVTQTMHDNVHWSMFVLPEVT